MIEIDRVVLNHYMERLTPQHKEQLIASIQNGAHPMGIAYVGPSVDIHLPFHLTNVGIPQLRPSHFHCGGLLTPVGKELAEMLIEDEVDDDYRLS